MARIEPNGAMVSGCGGTLLAGVATWAQATWPQVQINPMQVLIAMGLIAVVGLSMVLILHRRTVRRAGALGMIRQALLASAAGETSREALSLGAQATPEAQAWNQLIEELSRLRHLGAVNQVQQALGTRSGAPFDLSQACDTLSQGLLIVNAEGRVRYANGAAAVLLQRTREKLVGEQIESVLSDEPVRSAVAAALNGTDRQRRSLEVNRGGENGGEMLRFTLRHLRRDDPDKLLVAVEDITQQRVAEAARRSFVTQATHELRTPLANIRLYLETVLEQGETDALLRAKCLNVINQESRRLERMVGEMLSVAEIEAGTLKLRRDDVRLEKLLSELEADFAAAAGEKNLALRMELPPKLPVIQADREKLVLALHNLVGNAVKYTPAGGQVTVTARADEARLIVEISDSGIGIAPEEQERVFERFYRSADARVSQITGSGLGLALAREVARLHGGDITLRSELNKGSTFTLTLPSAASEKQAA